MKRNLIVALAMLSLVACKKEAMQTLNPSHDAKEIEMHAYTKLASMTKSERYNFIEEKRYEISTFQKTATLPEYFLEDAFLSLEGLINNDYYTYWEEFTNPVDYTNTFQLYFTIDGNGNRMVDAQDFTQVYTEIYNDVSNHVDVSNDEDFLLLDLTIEEIDDINGVATLGSNLTITTIPAGAIFLTPAGQVTAVKWVNGPCNPNGNATNDAADFLRTYANMMAPWRSLNCANGLYIWPIEGYRTSNKYQNFPYYYPNNDWINVINNYWHSNTNDCLGGPDPADWYAHYYKMDYLSSYGASHANAWLQSVNPNNDPVEFYYTDYHSHINDLTPGPGHGVNPDIFEEYYHGGMFVYAIIGCN